MVVFLFRILHTPEAHLPRHTCFLHQQPPAEQQRRCLPGGLSGTLFLTQNSPLAYTSCHGSMRCVCFLTPHRGPAKYRIGELSWHCVLIRLCTIHHCQERVTPLTIQTNQNSASE